MKRKVVIATLCILALVICSSVAGLFYFVDHRESGEYFDSKGVRIFYTVKGQGEPVILVHGFAVNGDVNWRRPAIIKGLATDHRVITLDLRGHGLSDKPHDPAQYGVEMVNDVVRLMDHLGIAKAHVVGYSMGGFITLKLLTMYPERLLSAAPCAAGWGKLDAQNSKLIDDVASSLESGEGMAPLFRRLEPNGKEPPRLRVLFMNFLLGHMNDEKALAAAMRGFPALAITEEQLRANKVPVLSIVGSADPLKEGVDALTGVLSNHEVIVIKGGDHMTTISNPGFIQGLRDFLTRHAAGANAPTETAAPAGGLTESPNAV